ncbi:MAG: PAS domain S-box protein [Magnetococcales bacterium]|nr:PAS domain S-box protein [Magnetococcales bacterium]
MVNVETEKSDSLNQTILIVDDETTTIDIIKSALKDSGRLLVATNGNDALRVLKSNSVDLVLLDIIMPGMSGYDVCRALKKNTETASIPIIFLTAKGHDLDEIEGLSLGAVDYIRKPFLPGLLALRVANQLELSRYRNQLEALVYERTRKLEKVQKSLYKAQEISHLGNWEWDLNTHLHSWSDELFRIFGFLPQQFEPTYDDFIKVIHPDDLMEASNTIKKILVSSETNCQSQHRIITKDGEEKIVLGRGELLRDETGKPVRMIGTVQDITEQQRVENVLHESELRFKSIVEHSPIGIVISLPSGKISATNKAFQTILGYNEHELSEMNVNEISDPRNPETIKKQIDNLLSGKQDFIQLEKRYLHKDGKTIWARVSAGTVKNDYNEVMFNFSFVESLMEQRQSDLDMSRVKEQLEVKERERLARELHDGPLQDFQLFILEMKQLVLGQLSNHTVIRDEVSKAISNIINGTDALRQIASQWYPEFLERMGLVSAIKTTSSKLMDRTGVNIEVTGGEDWEIVDSVISRNVFMIFREAVTNAVRHADVPNIWVVMQRTEPGRHILTITDNGHGFESQDVKASSVGLAIMRERAQRIKVELDIQSKLGHGTTIKIEIPTDDPDYFSR